MFKDVTKTYFDGYILKIGTKIHIKRLLSCKYINGEKSNCIYDIDDTAEIISIIYADGCDEIDTITVQFQSYRDEYDYDFDEITVDEVLNGEWEIEII